MSVSEDTRKREDYLYNLRAGMADRWTDSELRKKLCNSIKIAMLKRYEDPEERIKASISKKKWHEEHPGAHAGMNNPNWQGGPTEYPFEFNSKFTKLIRERYRYICMICKRKQEQLMRLLDVHHIDYDKNNLHPDNFVPLCIPCHNVTKSKKNRVYWIRTLQNMVEVNI